MKRKHAHLLVSALLLFFLGISLNHASAQTQVIISKEKAFGYQYSIYQKDDTFLWEIGHQDQLVTVKENKKNREDLEHFFLIVNKLDISIYQLIIFSFYFLIILTSLFFAKKKNIIIPRSVWIFIIGLLGYAIYQILVPAFELNHLVDEASLYYYRLTH
ncbi:hypothetical protein [Rossellomorea aquimaris]|uniref:hypothetical protein n=1 Tax=Rossellomorea aquimaris TaxID=189382 RepID=UPI0007D0B74B|nr:hypothetical protein [Rossellomorea aquimaris]